VEPGIGQVECRLHPTDAGARNQYPANLAIAALFFAFGHAQPTN
jgi:hypothetical protein